LLCMPPKATRGLMQLSSAEPAGKNFPRGALGDTRIHDPLHFSP